MSDGRNPYSSPIDTPVPQKATATSAPPGIAKSVTIVVGATLCGFALILANNMLVVFFLLFVKWPLGDWASAIGMEGIWRFVWPHITDWPMAMAFGVAIGAAVPKRWFVASLCGGLSFAYGAFLWVPLSGLAAQVGTSAVVSFLAWKTFSALLVLCTAFLSSRMIRNPRLPALDRITRSTAEESSSVSGES